MAFLRAYSLSVLHLCITLNGWLILVWGIWFSAISLFRGLIPVDHHGLGEKALFLLSQHLTFTDARGEKNAAEST